MTEMPYPERSKIGPWGKWEFDPEMLVIRWTGRGIYEFDLEGMSSSRAILDMIFQLNGHIDAVFTREDMGYLLEAIERLLNPQGNYCGASTYYNPMTPEKHKKLMKSLSKDGQLVNLKE